MKQHTYKRLLGNDVKQARKNASKFLLWFLGLTIVIFLSLILSYYNSVVKSKVMHSMSPKTLKRGTQVDVGKSNVKGAELMRMQQVRATANPCARPTTWCTFTGARYLLTDCDGDGVADHVCMDLEGNLGVIQSSNSCKDSWPHGECIAKPGEASKCKATASGWDEKCAKRNVRFSCNLDIPRENDKCFWDDSSDCEPVFSIMKKKNGKENYEYIRWKKYCSDYTTPNPCNDAASYTPPYGSWYDPSSKATYCAQWGPEVCTGHWFWRSCHQPCAKWQPQRIGNGRPGNNCVWKPTQHCAPSLRVYSNPLSEDYENAKKQCGFYTTYAECRSTGTTDNDPRRKTVDGKLTNRCRWDDYKPYKRIGETNPKISDQEGINLGKVAYKVLGDCVDACDNDKQCQHFTACSEGTEQNCYLYTGTDQSQVTENEGKNCQMYFKAESYLKIYVSYENNVLYQS